MPLETIPVSAGGIFLPWQDVSISISAEEAVRTAVVTGHVPPGVSPPWPDDNATLTANGTLLLSARPRSASRSGIRRLGRHDRDGVAHGRRCRNLDFAQDGPGQDKDVKGDRNVDGNNFTTGSIFDTTGNTHHHSHCTPSGRSPQGRPAVAPDGPHRAAPAGERRCKGVIECRTARAL